MRSGDSMISSESICSSICPSGAMTYIAARARDRRPTACTLTERCTGEVVIDGFVAIDVQSQLTHVLRDVLAQLVR